MWNIQQYWILIPLYAEELKRNESDFSITLLFPGIGFVIGSVVNTKYFIPYFKNINHKKGFITLILALIGLIGS